MGTTSISGLASGLDTASIIDQLMQLEAVPQTKLKTSLASEQSTLKVLQALNAKVAALTTQAQTVAKADGWTALRATSSSTAVSASTTSGTTSGSFSFHVDATAVAYQRTFTDPVASGSAVVLSGTDASLVRQDGTSVPLATAHGTLDELVSALNASGTGVSATKVKVGAGDYRLVVTNTDTGAGSGFTLKNTDGTDVFAGSEERAGVDAKITLGTSTPITSHSNTFTGILSGVDLTISKAAVGTDVDITVAKDSSQVKASVKAFVAAVNDTLSAIDSQTSYNSTTKTSGPLASDAGVRNLRTSLLNAVYPSDGTSMASVGLQTDRTGKLVFDESAFDTAYAADPAKVAAAFTTGATDGFAARLATVANTASDRYTGTITSAITGRTSTIDRLNDSISDWDTRLDLKRTTLSRQYTALETALNQMNSQSTWLAGQISSLPTSS